MLIVYRNLGADGGLGTILGELQPPKPPVVPSMHGSLDKLS